MFESFLQTFSICIRAAFFIVFIALEAVRIKDVRIQEGKGFVHCAVRIFCGHGGFSDADVRTF